MRKVTVGLVLCLLSVTIAFSAGLVNLQMSPNASWTQTLTFSVKQWIKVNWSYDETQAFAIDDQSRIASIGNFALQSNKKFKVYYGIGNTLPSGISVTSLKVGSTAISSSSTSPTEVSTKLLSGVLTVEFSDVSSAENDFQVKFDFTFLPF